ncbi:DUF2264 domain-containing protein [Luteipulveratus mongoliensis]|uniref:DUF2264 domain-containing protein n=1 Tax=Luteipulveratus mongoliensis TaxID=571913 RepID=A0A0K1JGA1_9MICO|nr:DUF2264 domain-containing protein [Luteipulveratus mongoliensis]AKU15635.1 hypothetical protein VV02_06840 [Luteipulveratus mongoliensis]
MNHPPATPFLPPTNRVQSSRTGWTRDHWEALADHLLNSLAPWASPSGALISPPGRASWSGLRSDGLEGFARSFMLASFRLAHGGSDELAERYAAGLVAGADPDHPDAWPRLTDCSQQLVEAAAVAIGLHESRARIWDQLDDRERALVVDWLAGFVGARTWDNNWVLFQVVVEEFLASVGGPFDRGEIDSGLDRIENWYVGDGWYTDGPGQNFDNYNGWALHLYPLLWARIADATGDVDTATRRGAYQERLKRHLQDAVHLFGTDGAPVHFGRSLAYRIGCLAPFWLGELEGCSPLEPGATRRLASGAARHFVERGVPDHRGLLTLGWYDTFLPATQPYSGPGSPYWASKGFLGLLLPPDHPVWTAPERAVPLDLADQQVTLTAPGQLVQATHHDGIVRLLNHGSDHLPLPDETTSLQPPEADPHYGRLAFSSRTGPETDAHEALDNQLILRAPDGARTAPTQIRRLGTGERYARSCQQAPHPIDTDRLCRLETASVVHGSIEVRVHRVDAPAGCTTLAGGYAIASHSPLETGHSAAGLPWALARRADGLTSLVIGLHGWDTASIRNSMGTNAFGPHSATPYLQSAPGPDTPTTTVAAVVLTGDACWPDALARSISARVQGDQVRIRFPDDREVILAVGSEDHDMTCVWLSPDGPEVQR